jgi:heterotetrameric sarcosine oxidase gamma subunit
MVAPVSALGAAAAARRVLPKGVEEVGVRLTEVPIGALWQVSAWPGALGAAGAAAAAAAGAEATPGPGRGHRGTAGWVLRTEPLKWLVLSDGPLPAPSVAGGAGTVLDLGHARTRMRIEGPRRVDLLARLVSVDCREAAFPEGSVATTPLHHLAVTLLARGEGVDVLLPRSFARSLFGHVAEVAEQFGLEIS